MGPGGIIWITGIPASGKSTLAKAVAGKLRLRNGLVEILDGDEMRQGICKGLGFSSEDRAENLRRVAWAACALARNGVWVLVAVVSPFHVDRAAASETAELQGTPFFQVYTKCRVEIAESRDEKGNYAKARAGEIRGFTGVDAPYEEPENADLVLETAFETPDTCAEQILSMIQWRPDDNPPTICIGRGFGGTRFTSMMVQDLGVFIGSGAGVNGCEDSMAWQLLVYKMVHETAGKLNFPVGRQYRQEILDMARTVLASAPVSPGTPWGMKLPEITLVVPFFVDAFPKARFIHLIRHPLASSFRSPHHTSKPDDVLGKSALPGAYLFAGRDVQHMVSDPAWLVNAISWQHQVTRAACYGRALLGPERYLEVRFEDIRADAEAEFAKVERFLGLSRKRWHSSAVYDTKRAIEVASDDPRIEKVWEICGSTAAMLGYTQENY